MAPVDLTFPRAEFLDLVLAGDRDAARSIVHRLVDEGVDARPLLSEVLGPAQLAVGSRWERDELSVADEHAATAIVDTVLAELVATIAPAPDDGCEDAVLVCAEGEWHTLPARFAAALLQLEGVAVRFLGGSVPADHLQRHLAARPPVATCISCSVSLFLPGALRSIEASHRAGVPVLAGGAGFGPDAHAALRLGADAWAASPAEAAAVIRLWHGEAPAHLAPSTADVASWSELELARGEAEGMATRELLCTSAGASLRDDERDACIRQLLDYGFRMLSAAMLVDDERVFVTFVTWLERVLSARSPLQLDAARAMRAMADALGGIAGVDRFVDAAAAHLNSAQG